MGDPVTAVTPERGEGLTDEWEPAADALCAAVEKRIEATARKAAESLYEGLLYDTQEYIRDNVRFNLRAELDRAMAETARCREALSRAAAAAGVKVQNHYDATADAIAARIYALEACPAPSPVTDEVVEVLREALARVKYVPGDHPVVPIKHAAFVEDMRSLLAKLEAGK